MYGPELPARYGNTKLVGTCELGCRRDDKSVDLLTGFHRGAGSMPADEALRDASIAGNASIGMVFA